MGNDTLKEVLPEAYSPGQFVECAGLPARFSCGGKPPHSIVFFLAEACRVAPHHVECESGAFAKLIGCRSFASALHMDSVAIECEMC